MRKERKREHVENYLRTTATGDTLLGDVLLEHVALPELSMDEISTETKFLGKTLAFPLMIDSMTGGADISTGINRDLSMLAKRFGLPMAVGSQKIALEDAGARESFELVRDLMGPEGIILANLDARAGKDEIDEAVKMIDADAIELHLNAAQELAMPEGDRDFRGIVENLRERAREEHTIMVKEVGFGLDRTSMNRLYSCGIRYFDLAGRGGTNFLQIEAMRQNETDYSALYEWGNPTAECLIRAKDRPADAFVVASGGIRTEMDIVRALVLGADMVAMSGEILTYLVHGGYEYTVAFLEGLIYKVKMLMLLAGARTLEDLRHVPYRLKGELRARVSE